MTSERLAANGYRVKPQTAIGVTLCSQTACFDEEGAKPLTSSAMPALGGLNGALRELRQRAGIRSQGEWARRARLGLGTVNKVERGLRLPDGETLQALLDSAGATLLDLAVLLGEKKPIPPGVRVGTARPEWVATFVRKGIDSSFLMGFAVAGIEAGDERALQDFIASVEAAAGELARAAVEEARASHEAATKGRARSD